MSRDREHISDAEQRKRTRGRALATLATRQFGVVSRAQLVELGFGEMEVRTMVRTGHLHRIHRGVYAVGHRKLINYAHLRAALLAYGDAAFLSHRSAAAVWGLRQINRSRIEVTVPGLSARPRRGLVVHRTATTLDDLEVTTENGLRVSTVARVLLESAAHEPGTELDRLITEAVRRRILDLDATELLISRHCRHSGVAKLKRGLHDYRPRPDSTSELEEDFHARLAGTPVPTPLRNVRIAGYECDCHWPEHDLVVELDGRPYHLAIRDTERDKRKDAKLLVLGIRTMRITDLRFAVQWDEILDELIQLTT